MKLKTDELRRYLSAAGQIKPNPTAINLDSIKIECTGQEVIFTKTNNNIWCWYSYVCRPQEPCCYLINEKILNGIALTTKEAEIEIQLHINGNDIQIISGEDVVLVKNQDLKLFPAKQFTVGERVKIEKEVVDRIRVAAKYVSTGANITALNFVSISDRGIFASNGSILYFHNEYPLPDVLLDLEPLNTIKGGDDLLYWQSESYNFFQSDGFTYGFIKTAVNQIDYMPIVAQAGTDSFVCKREDLIDFCTLVHYSKRQEYPLATLQQKDANLLLTFNDADYGINVSRTIIMEANSNVELFKFSVDWLSILLKTLSFELLTFTKVSAGHYIITTAEDPYYKGILARLAD